METFGERLRATRLQRGLSRNQLAKQTGISYSTLANTENGAIRSSTKIPALARVLDVADEWLATGRGARERITYTFVAPRETAPAHRRFPLLEGYAGMGRGDYVGGYPEVVQFVEVTQEWASQALRGVPPEAVRVITGRGPSMRGVFDDGDLIFMDSRVKEFAGDAAYCFRWNGLVYIKRLQQIDKDHLRVLSANADYPPYDVPLSEIEIGGRALAAWTLKQL